MDAVDYGKIAWDVCVDKASDLSFSVLEQEKQIKKCENILIP